MENEFNYSQENNFKQVPNKPKMGFGKTVFIPFVSGIVGTTLVISTCLSVPSLKEKLFTLNNTTINENKNNDNSSYNAKLIDLAEYSETAVAVAELVQPSVVGITVTYNVSSFGTSGTASATGSGVIISEDGYIITNNHVINSESSSNFYQVTEATKITVHLYGEPNDVQYEAEIIGSDSSTDLAVLKIETDKELQAITVGDSDNLRVGEFVMAVGNPLGLDSSVTVGIISALDREITDSDENTYTTIQTDAAINSGNSGGALVNSKGELIGINSLKLSGSDIEGIGFAMPINSSMDIINQLIEHGTVKRPYIGIEGSSLTEALSKRYNLPVGVYVESVQKDFPADKAGIQESDIITEVEGQAVTSVKEMNEIKNKHAIGDTITVKIYRDNKYQDIKITLGEAPEQEATTDSYDDIFDYFQSRR